MESLKQSISQMTDMFNTRMAEFQQELQSTSHQTASPTSKLTSDFNQFKTFVLNALKSLQAQIEGLMELQDQSEMKSRKKILLLHGVPEEKKELHQTISALILSQLKLTDFDSNSIKYTHRLGRVNNSKPRPVLIKFHNVASRNKVWKAKTNLKNSGITMSEFLTKRRHEIFLLARQRFGLHKCWTQDGYIIVIGPDGSRNRICSMVDLDAIQSPTPEDPVVVAVSSAPVHKEKMPPATRSKKVVRCNK